MGRLEFDPLKKPPEAVEHGEVSYDPEWPKTTVRRKEKIKADCERE
jgi:hypothetical protein